MYTRVGGYTINLFNLVTYDKSAVYTNNTSHRRQQCWNDSNEVGLSSEPQLNARVSGWIWLSPSPNLNQR